MKKCVEEAAASGPEGPMRFFDSEYRMNLQVRPEEQDCWAASQGQREGLWSGTVSRLLPCRPDPSMYNLLETADS